MSKLRTSAASSGKPSQPGCDARSLGSRRPLHVPLSQHPSGCLELSGVPTVSHARPARRGQAAPPRPADFRRRSPGQPLRAPSRCPRTRRCLRSCLVSIAGGIRCRDGPGNELHRILQNPHVITPPLGARCGAGLSSALGEVTRKQEARSRTTGGMLCGWGSAHVPQNTERLHAGASRSQVSPGVTVAGGETRTRGDHWRQGSGQGFRAASRRGWGLVS